MLKIIKQIYTILVLLKNLIFRKEHYTLKFVAEKDSVIKRWYYHFKWWGFSHDNLEMVAGADDLCELYSEGKDEVTVDIVASKNIHPEYATEYDFYEGLPFEENGIIEKYLYGRTYQNAKTNEDGKMIITTIWICPVTLFVLGRYPNCLYIKKHG